MANKEERTRRALEYAFQAFDKSFSCSESSFAGLLREFCPELSEEEKSRLISVDSMMMGRADEEALAVLSRVPCTFWA